MALATGFGCGDEPAPEPDAAAPPAPVTPRAGVVLEPPRLRLGSTAWVEVGVVTPPGYRVPPVEAPEETPGLWVLEAERPEVSKQPSRWVHRTRFLVRARETGRFAWPAQSLVALGPEGERLELRTEARPIRVAEVEAVESPEAGASEPSEGGAERYYGLRAPAPEAAPGGLLLGAALGAAFGAAALALVLLALRARRARRAPPFGPPPLTTAAAASAEQRAALQAIAEAAERAEAEPRAAAEAGAAALRRLLARRYGLPARTATTPELAAARQPAGLGRRYEAIVTALGELDAVRFGPESGGPEADARRVRAALGGARAAVSARGAASAGAAEARRP